MRAYTHPFKPVQAEILPVVASRPLSVDLALV